LFIEKEIDFGAAFFAIKMNFAFRLQLIENSILEEGALTYSGEMAR